MPQPFGLQILLVEARSQQEAATAASSSGGIYGVGVLCLMGNIGRDFSITLTPSTRFAVENCGLCLLDESELVSVYDLARLVYTVTLRGIMFDLFLHVVIG